MIINILHTHTHITMTSVNALKRDRQEWTMGWEGGGSEEESARFIRMALRLAPAPAPTPTPPPSHSSRSLGNFDWRPSPPPPPPPTGSLTASATWYPHPPSHSLHATPFHYRPRLRLCLEKITIISRMYLSVY